MTDKSFSGRVLRFGPFQVNLATRELRKHGLRVRLPGQPFSVLAMLLERPGDVFTREEIRERLWSRNTFVDHEHSLNSAVKKLRTALGDSPENSRYIETLPRIGYRFIAPMEEIVRGEDLAGSAPTAAQAPANPPAEPPRTTPVLTATRRHILPALAGVCAVLALLAAVWLFARGRSRRPATDARVMLAVLPFENLTGDPTQDYLTEGLTEEMIAQLGRLDPQHLGVIARGSVMRYKRGQTEPAQVGSELGVQYILEGSVRREADRVRIASELIQVKGESHVWSRQYDRELNGLLALQTEIGAEIADEIHLALTGRSPALRTPTPPVSYEAYDLYLRGRYFWNKRTRDGFGRAEAYFQQAVEKYPTYARAYAGLADTYALMSTWSIAPPMESMPKAKAAALHALEIDESLAEAHTSLALVAEQYDYDWQTADRQFRRAIELDPGYATAHQWYAECLAFQGRFAEALAESERARQLDPLSLIIATDHGAVLYFARQYDRAIEQFRSVQALEPGFARSHLLTQAYVEKGMYAEALQDEQAWHREDGTPFWEIQAFVYGRAGRREEALRAFEKWKRWRRGRGSQYPPFTAELMAYISLGQKDAAIRFIEQAYAQHSNAIIEIKVAPYCDPLRGDPRFQDVLHRLNLN